MSQNLTDDANIGSDDGYGTKPLPEPMLTKI